MKRYAILPVTLAVVLASMELLAAHASEPSGASLGEKAVAPQHLAGRRLSQHELAQLRELLRRSWAEQKTLANVAPEDAASPVNRVRAAR